jgi:ribosomal protein L16/L10AE
MRAMTCGIFMVAGLTIAALSIWIEGNPVHAQRNPLQQRMGKGLLALTVPVGPDKEFVALVDPVQKVMGVYQVDAESGEILLKSVRNVNWDLQLDEFNGSSPSPREIRAMLE